MNWFSKLIQSIEVAFTGSLADNLKASLQSGAFRKFQEAKGIDVAVSNEVTAWFNSKFKVWFSQLLSMLHAASNYADPTYVVVFNSLIQSLEVARAFYSKQANTALTTSLKNVALGKVMILQEIIESLVFSYEQALKAMGVELSKGMAMTDATHFKGSTPEAFKWHKKEVLVNHIKFLDMQENAPQEQSQACAKTNKDYLPWIITGAFFLIAWGSAVTKPKIN